MHIIKVTWRHRNDFHFTAYCRHCQKTSNWGDGYANAYYQEEVFPHRRCPECGVDEFGTPTIIETGPTAATAGSGESGESGT